MLRSHTIHKKKGLSVLFTTLALIFNLYSITNSDASESLSYSGRLVKTNGAPVAGPVDLKIELSYTNAPTTILCTQNFTGVVLSNGVFHLKLDLDCGTNGTLAEVLTAVPAGESAAIRVTDVTHSKVYSFQALRSMPFASISETAKQLVQMGATNNQVLKWNDTSKKWEPGATPGGGSVTNVSGSAPISISSGSTTPTISISKADNITDGYLAAADWTIFNNKQASIVAGTTAQYYRGDKSWQTLDTSVVPENIANLYFTNARVLGVPLAGFVTGTGAIVATDTTLQAFGKVQGQINSIVTTGSNYLIKNSTDAITGVVNVGTIGLLQLAYTPVGLNDATNKAYVDSAAALRVSKTGDTMSGVLTLDSDLKIKGGVNYVTVKGHATSAAYNLILPSSAGTVGYVLSTDGSGNTSWINPSSVAAGTGTVDSASIVDGTIVNADINASAAIAQSKIANLTTDLSTINSNIAALTTTNIAEGTNLYFTNARVLGLALTGLNTGTSGSITATDSVLAAFGKLQYQVTDLNLKGQWDKSGSDVVYSAGDVRVDNNLKFKDSTTNYVLLKAPSTVTATYTLTLPPAKATVVGQVLTSDTSGVLSWTTVTDASVQAFAKSALPTCAAGEVLKSNGTSFACVTDNAGAGAFSGTANKAVVTNGSGALAVSASSDTEVGYLAGVTSAIQTQLNAKVSTTLPSTNILVGNGSNVATAVAMSGDATLANTGAITLKNTGTAGTYSSVTTDAQGRVTAGTNPTVVTSITGTAPVTIGGTAAVPVVSMAAATTAVNGYLTSTDWNTFNGKQAALSTGPIINGIVYPATGAQTLQIPLAPVALTDAVNKQYVDSFGQWTTSAGNVYRTTGNVGIGTTAPLSLVDMYKVGSGSSSVGAVLRDNVTPTFATNADNLLTVRGTGSSTSVWRGRITAGGDNAAFLMGEYSSKAWLGAHNAALGAWADLYISPDGNTQKTYIGSIGGVGGGAAMTVQSSNGNVGIGTTVPATKLDVVGTSALQLRLADTSTDATNKQSYITQRHYTNAEEDISLIVGTSNSTASTLRYGGGSGSLNAVTELQFYTAASNTTLTGTQRMTIDTNGNVGIGTTSPTEALSIAGTTPAVSITNGSDKSYFGTYGGLFQFSYNRIPSTGVIPNAAQSSAFVNVSGGGTSSYISFVTGNAVNTQPSEAMRIIGNGNVGIGTTTPQSKLDVNGAIRVGVDATACSATISGAMRFNTPNVEFCNGTSWAAFGTSGATVASSQITDETIVDADINAAANITATKLGTGAVDNTEFNYLDGVTSSIQTQLNAKQPLDATLTSLAAYNTNGIMVQTAADTFVGRSIAGTSNRVTVTNGSGVAGNPTIDIPTALLPSPVVGDVGKFLKATAADTSVWTALGSSDITTALGFTPINKAGDSLTTGTFTLSGAAVLRSPDPIGLTDVANKQYVDGFGQWIKSGSDIYRSGGNVGIGTTSPGEVLEVNGNIRIADSKNLKLGDTAATIGKIVGASNPNKYLELEDGAGNGAWSAYGALRFITNNGATEGMRITSAGNVGIGTTSPTGTLHVAGGTAAASTDGVSITLASQAAGTGNQKGGDVILLPGAKTGTGASSSVLIGTSTNPGWLLPNSLYVAGSIATAGGQQLGSGANFSWGTGTASFKGVGGSSSSDYLSATTNSIERMRIDGSGNVGIGTTSPNATLQVNGTITGKASVSNATSTVDFATGNQQYTTSSCGAFNLNNLKDGGSYAFAVQGSTAALCSFSAYSDAGVTALTVHMPPNHGLSTASTHTLYNYMVMGTHVYVSWVPGY